MAAHDSAVYVADSYNHKIKKVTGLTEKKQTAATYAGSREAGDAIGRLDEARFNEIGGLCIIGGKLYLADTNNHKIKVIDLTAESVATVPIGEASPDQIDAPVRKEKYSCEVNENVSLSSEGGNLVLSLKLTLP